MNNNIFYNKKAQWTAYILVFLVLLSIPFFYDDPFQLNILARYAVFALLAVSVSMVWGFGGILSLGQGIAFGLAAYGMAMTMQMQYQDPVSAPIPTFMLTNELESLPLMWYPFWSTTIGIILTFAIPTLFFAGFGYMMFQARVAGVFVAIMTLAMLGAWYSMAYDMQPFTAGFNGITPPNAFEIFGGEVDPYSSSAYWVSVGFLAVLVLASKALLETKFGTIIQAIRDDSERARFLGYNVAFYQIVIFTISGFIASAAGFCWVMLTQYVSPTAMELSFSISCVVWAAVGGRLSLLGAAIGAYLINGMQSYFGDEFQQLWLIILGVLFIGVVLLLPKGLIGLLEIVLGKFSSEKKDNLSSNNNDKKGLS